MTPKSGNGMPPLSAFSTATNIFNNKRDSHQAIISSAEISLECTSNLNSKKPSLLNRAEVKANQKKAGILLSAGKSRHFSPQRSSHQECRVISQLQ